MNIVGEKHQHLLMTPEQKKALDPDGSRALPLFSYETVGSVTVERFIEHLLERYAPKGLIWAVTQEDDDDFGKHKKTHTVTGVAFYDPSYPCLEPHEVLIGNPEHSRRVLFGLREEH